MTPSDKNEHWFDEHVAPELLREFHIELNTTSSNPKSNMDRDFSSRVMDKIRTEQIAIEQVELKRSRRTSERTGISFRYSAILASVFLLFACLLYLRSTPESVDVHSRNSTADDSEMINTPAEQPHSVVSNGPPLSDQTADAGMQLVNMGLSGTIRATQNPGDYVCQVFEKLTRNVDRPDRKAPSNYQSSVFRSSQQHLVASVASQLLGRHPD